MGLSSSNTARLALGSELLPGSELQRQLDVIGRSQLRAECAQHARQRIRQGPQRVQVGALFGEIQRRLCLELSAVATAIRHQLCRLEGARGGAAQDPLRTE